MHRVLKCSVLTVLCVFTLVLNQANNFYSQLLDMKRPDGSKLFNVLHISMLCDACLAEGRTACPHKAELPSWKSGERQEIIEHLMQGDKAMYMRENLGIVTQTDSFAFDQKAITALCREETFRFLTMVTSPQVVYVCIDPCGGGASSLALVAGFIDLDGHLVVRTENGLTAIFALPKGSCSPLFNPCVLRSPKFPGAPKNDRMRIHIVVTFW